MTIQQYPAPEAAGIPSGNTAGRPAAPVIGDQYYNGQEGYLEIYNGTNWIPASAVPGQPTITVADVGTSVAYGSAQATVTITAASDNVLIDSYKAYASSGGYIGNSTTSVVTITVGNNGSYSFNGTTFSPFGESSPSALVSATLTTLPQAPTIGTATTTGATTDVTVTWTLGSNGGKNLSSITITPYLNGTTAQTSQTAATTSSTTHTFTGLTQGSAYTFKVKTANANGDSLESSATNSVTIPTLVTVNYLVVAGGGGGGGASAYNLGGAGGAGGLRSTVTATGGGGSLETALNCALSTNFTVTVGAGGAGGSGGNNGVEGNNSVFSTVTSTGGGKGAGTGGSGESGNGGSGGGGAGTSGTGTRPGGTGTANQGYAGGTGLRSDISHERRAGGGGGGANAVGAAGAYEVRLGLGPFAYGGNGGNGVATDISGSSVTYAGGGGGSGWNYGGTGGTGGGGNGSDSNSGETSGTANSGGGGGGVGNSSGRSGGAGGSGVVILRYPDTRTITIGAGLTGTTSAASGGFKRTTLTAGTGNVSWV
jgi:hypothetical protein